VPDGTGVLRDHPGTTGCVSDQTFLGQRKRGVESSAAEVSHRVSLSSGFYAERIF
jgi:hypothetical protein